MREFKHNFTYITQWVGRENGILYITCDDKPWLKVCHPTEMEKEEMKSQMLLEKKKRKYADGY